MPVLDPAALLDDRVQAIRAYHESTGIARAELDISGGVDSAVLVALLARAIGPENITAVYSSIHSSLASRERARLAAEAAGVALIELELGPVFDQLRAHLEAQLEAAGYDLAAIEARVQRDPTVLGSLRSCLRAPVGRGLNRMTGGGIRHGTGNECEDRWLRFYQKGGDGEVDTNPIAMLAKGEVYQLARALGVPRAIIDALPTPDLHGTGDAHNDEDELRALTGVDWSYSRIDVDTGAYTKVGTIERMSRFMDLPAAAELLAQETPDDNAVAAMVAAARPLFPEYDDTQIAAYLRSARRCEATSRHKWNPNCPALGERGPLVARGVLTNVLPLEVGAAR